MSEKTRSNVRSILHDFFTWLSDREDIPVPKMPKIKFTMGWRNIIDIETQRAIIDEVRRISEKRTPRIWIAINWLSTYVSIRPKEMLSLTEGQINVNGFFVIYPRDAKERDSKLVSMIPEDIELYDSLPRGLPHMSFFRHDLPHGQTKAGDKFGQRYLYKWWKRACKNLGIEGVDLYGGTRHSTISSLGNDFNEQELRDAGTMHKTDVAFQRYYQGRKKDSVNIYSRIRENQHRSSVVNLTEFKASKSL